jgi:hypothetical protein
VHPSTTVSTPRVEVREITLVTASTAAPSLQPSSASATNTWQATCVTCASARSAWMARSYAPPCTVPSVASTAMRPLALACAGGARAGLDDADHRQIREPFAQGRQRRGGGRIAGHDQRLDAPLHQSLGARTE